MLSPAGLLNDIGALRAGFFPNFFDKLRHNRICRLGR
jgi:hypothetical protein